MILFKLPKDIRQEISYKPPLFREQEREGETEPLKERHTKPFHTKISLLLPSHSPQYIFFLFQDHEIQQAKIPHYISEAGRSARLWRVWKLNSASIQFYSRKLILQSPGRKNGAISGQLIIIYCWGRGTKNLLWSETCNRYSKDKRWKTNLVDMKKRYGASFPQLDKVIFSCETILTWHPDYTFYKQPLTTSNTLQSVNNSKRWMILNETCYLWNEDICSCIKYEVISLKLKMQLNHIFNCLKLTQNWLPNPFRE